MTATNGWPGKPGVPLNPEKGGWHWLVGVTERPAAFEWLAYKQAWLFHRAQPEALAMTPPAFGSWTYLGPVLTPDEASALQKRCEEAERTALQAADCHARETCRADALQKRVAELEEALRKIQSLARTGRPHPMSRKVDYFQIAAAALTGGKDE